MDKIKVGNFLADLRNEKGLTQEQLAEMLNVNYKTISKWECGNSLPSLETFSQLSEIYDISLYELSTCEKITNPLISKNNIKRVVNQESIKKFLTIKIILLIITTILLIFTSFTYIYTINNYNQMQIYELMTNDNNFNIKGIYVKTHNEYFISISYINVNDSYTDHILNSLQYSIKIDNIVKEKSNINFDRKTSLHQAMQSIKIYLSDKILHKNSQSIEFNIKYETEEKNIINKTIEINLSQKQSNNKLFY